MLLMSSKNPSSATWLSVNKNTMRLSLAQHGIQLFEVLSERHLVIASCQTNFKPTSSISG